jgi:hypothetical protein
MAAETTTTALSVLSLVIGFLRAVVGETHPRKVVPSIQTNVNPGFPYPCCLTRESLVTMQE